MTVSEGPARAERRRTRTYAMCSVAMLAASATLRIWAPSPYAPRVHIRWAAGISDVERADQERRFTLVEAQHREDTTWGYEISDPSPPIIQAIIDHPAVADTHYIDRQRAAIVHDAPRGSTRLAHPGMSAWVGSVFDWLMCFSVSSLVVSGAWLASAGNPRRN